MAYINHYVRGDKPGHLYGDHHGNLKLYLGRGTIVDPVRLTATSGHLYVDVGTDYRVIDGKLDPTEVVYAVHDGVVDMTTTAVGGKPQRLSRDTYIVAAKAPLHALYDIACVTTKPVIAVRGCFGMVRRDSLGAATLEDGSYKVLTVHHTNGDMAPRDLPVYTDNHVAVQTVKRRRHRVAPIIAGHAYLDPDGVVILCLGHVNLVNTVNMDVLSGYIHVELAYLQSTAAALTVVNGELDLTNANGARVLTVRVTATPRADAVDLGMAVTAPVTTLRVAPVEITPAPRGLSGWTIRQGNVDAVLLPVYPTTGEC